MTSSPPSLSKSLSKTLRVVFAGTPAFARVALALINQDEHRSVQVVGVLTQPDRPAGRGLKLHSSEVKNYALEHGLPVIQPRSLKLDGKFPLDAQQALDQLKVWKPDVIVVAAYGLLLPQWTLDLAPLGCLNIHASLLPRWRGAAPIHRAIEAGDEMTGICIMQMDTGLDTGGILAKEACAILPSDTTDSLHERLAFMGANLLRDTLTQLGSLKAIPQSHEGANYAHKIEKIETWVDWSMSSKAIERKMRAFSSTPGLQTHIAEDVYKIWGGQALQTIHVNTLQEHSFGTILKIDPEGIDVMCGSGVFRITQIQRSGGKRIPIESFILGSTFQLGDSFKAGPPQVEI